MSLSVCKFLLQSKGLRIYINNIPVHINPEGLLHFYLADIWLLATEESVLCLSDHDCTETKFKHITFLILSLSL